MCFHGGLTLFLSLRVPSVSAEALVQGAGGATDPSWVLWGVYQSLWQPRGSCQRGAGPATHQQTGALLPHTLPTGNTDTQFPLVRKPRHSPTSYHYLPIYWPVVTLELKRGNTEEEELRQDKQAKHIFSLPSCGITTVVLVLFLQVLQYLSEISVQYEEEERRRMAFSLSTAVTIFYQSRNRPY